MGGFALPFYIMKIIGINRVDSECFEADSELNLSNIYLTELEGLDVQMLKDYQTCYKGDVLTHIDNAIENAERILISDCLNGKDYDEHSGRIGQLKIKELSDVDNYLVYKIHTRQMEGEIIKITDITTIFNTSEDIELKVFDETFKEIQTLTLKCLAGQFNINKVDINLSGSEFYYLVVPLISVPYLIKNVCCGDNYRYNESAPYFNNKNAGWYKLLQFKQYVTNDYMIEKDDKGIDANGLILNVKNLCDARKLIERSDYKYDKFGVAVALAIRYKAGSIMLTDAINRANVDLKNQEAMLASIGFWDSKYEKLASFIKTNTLKCFNAKKIFNTRMI
jgi:hypothetical protein